MPPTWPPLLPWLLQINQGHLQLQAQLLTALLLLQQPNRRGQLNLGALMVQLTWQLKRHLCRVVSPAGKPPLAVLLPQQLSSRLRLVGPLGSVAP